MPNHVHSVVALTDGWPLDKVVHSWKSYTANAINKQLGRNGDLWMPDYFDVLIRDEHMLEAIVRYTEYNPVAAGLCERIEDWPFSSAGYRGGSSV
jgi:putative transposase